MSAPREGQFPIAAEIAGVPVVTIPAAEYADLLQCRRRVARLSSHTGVRSPIDLDIELAAFLAEALQRQIIRDVHAACLARFGPDRTPSKSAIHRFWQRFRAGS